MKYKSVSFLITLIIVFFGWTSNSIATKEEEELLNPAKKGMILGKEQVTDDPSIKFFKEVQILSELFQDFENLPPEKQKKLIGDNREWYDRLNVTFALDGWSTRGTISSKTRRKFERLQKIYTNDSPPAGCCSIV